MEDGHPSHASEPVPPGAGLGESHSIQDTAKELRPMKDPIEKEIAEQSIAMENKEEDIVVENPTPTSETGVVHERVVQDGEVIGVGEGETSPPAAMETEEMSFEAPSSEVSANNVFHHAKKIGPIFFAPAARIHKF